MLKTLLLWYILYRVFRRLFRRSFMGGCRRCPPYMGGCRYCRRDGPYGYDGCPYGHW